MPKRLPKILLTGLEVAWNNSGNHDKVYGVAEVLFLNMRPTGFDEIQLPKVGAFNFWGTRRKWENIACTAIGWNETGWTDIKQGQQRDWELTELKFPGGGNIMPYDILRSEMLARFIAEDMTSSEIRWAASSHSAYDPYPANEKEQTLNRKRAKGYSQQAPLVDEAQAMMGRWQNTVASFAGEGGPNVCTGAIVAWLASNAGFGALTIRDKLRSLGCEELANELTGSVEMISPESLHPANVGGILEHDVTRIPRIIPDPPKKKKKRRAINLGGNPPGKPKSPVAPADHGATAKPKAKVNVRAQTGDLSARLEEVAAIAAATGTTVEDVTHAMQTLQRVNLQGTTTGRFSSDRLNTSNVPQVNRNSCNRCSVLFYPVSGEITPRVILNGVPYCDECAEWLASQDTPPATAKKCAICLGTVPAPTVNFNGRWICPNCYERQTP